MNRATFSLFFMLALLLLPILSAAEEEDTCQYPGHRWRGGRNSAELQPYGNYCPRRHADNYGARQPLQNIEEAKKRLSEFFNVPPAQVSVTRELKMGYIADISRPDGTVSYKVFIDKRSGRIRSIR